MKTIDFYYWGCQCPINHETLKLLNRFAQVADIRYYNLKENPQLTKELQIYFPFLTVFNGTKRWKSPLTQETVECFLNDEDFTEVPYIIEQGQTTFKGELKLLTSENVHLLAGGCTLGNCTESCKEKGRFLTGSEESYYGMLHLEEDKVVGGAEFLPSLEVPYPVPKDQETAFLTCVYHSSSHQDFKAYPLVALEVKLAEKYKRVIAVCDETGTFPNGNLKWFEAQGYEDLGLIAVEEGYCRLHLIEKWI